MQNWLLLLTYDGRNYHGWQVQPNGNTIQAELERALAHLTQQVTPVFGAGRTDAGVHALNQTAHFFSDRFSSPRKWCQALNGILPSDIVVKEVISVPSSFHARYSAQGKWYRYLVYNKPYYPPFARPYSWWVRDSLDFGAMSQAARHLEGTYDFSAFRATNCGSPHPIKTIQTIEWHFLHQPSATLAFEVCASGFLKNMVRILVGTLIDVGCGRIHPEEIPKILDSKNRNLAGKTAPAHGLYVLEVLYDPKMVQWSTNCVEPRLNS